MKSIYSKLILGFFVAILISMCSAGFFAIRSNFDAIESKTSSDLENVYLYLSNVIESIDISKNESIIDSYALSNKMNITVYTEKGFYKSYGLNLKHPNKNLMNGWLLKHNVQDDLGYKNDLISYGNIIKAGNQNVYIFIEKDISYEHNLVLNAAILILGIVFFVGSLVFLFVADFITKPIAKLTQATNELSKGNYSVRVQYTGNDEISKLNQSFNQMATQLAKTEQTRQKFISDISHEFQTPLTAIQGFANILKEEDLPSSLREKYADIILANSKRLSKLAKNMLQLTLLEDQEVKLDISTYSLTEQIERVISMENSFANEKNIEIEFENPNKDYMISGDESRLEQVWINLINNAIKYTNDNGVVTIEIKKTKKEYNVSISDTGIGMSKEAMSHIFERFYREDKARSVDGNGLGLSIVKTIVDLHEGSIDVASTIDVGTTFTVSLPYDHLSGYEIIKDKLIKK